jgi:hypothetical protein
MQNQLGLCIKQSFSDTTERIVTLKKEAGRFPEFLKDLSEIQVTEFM